MTRAHLIGIAAGAGAASCWGSATVFSKDLLQSFDPVSLLVIQLATSVAFLWALVLVNGRGLRHTAASARGITAYAWLGALEPALAYFLCLWGLAAATASGATLVQASESIMIVGVTTLLTRRLPSGKFLGISGVAVTALYFALGIEGNHTTGGSSPVGVALIAAGTFSAAIYVVLSGRVAQRAPALTITAWQQSVALALVLLVAAGLRLVGTGTPGAVHASARLLVLCAASGLLQFAVPFSLYMVALQRLSANVAGAMLLLTPLVGLVEAHVFLGEQLTSRQWAASLVVLAAVAGLAVVGFHTREPLRSREIYDPLQQN